MRCRSCDCVLTDKEAVRKNQYTKEYEDMCDECLDMSDEFDDEELEVIEDLMKEIFGDDA